jgi:MFS family permease
MADKPKKRGGILRGNIGVMILTSGLWNLAGSMTGPFFPLYVLELGGNYVDIGIISALRAIVVILPSLLGGYLADAVGRKRMLYSMSFLLSLNQLLYALAPHYSFLFLVVTLDALWEGLRSPSFAALIADSTVPRSRAFAYGLWQITPSLFGLFSPYVIGVLMDSYGIVVALRWAYAAVFTTSFIASTLRYKLLVETLPAEDKKKTDPKTAVRETLSDFRDTAKSIPRQIWMIFVLNYISNFAGSLCGSYFVTYAKNRIGLSMAEWGLISTLLTAVNIAVRLPAALASDRYGRLKFIMPSLFLTPLTFFLFVRCENFQQVAMVRTAMTMLDSVQGPSREALVVDFSPREHRGRITAIANISNAPIGSAASVIGGALYQDVSTEAPFFTCSALLLVGALYALLALKEPKRREE